MRELIPVLNPQVLHGPLTGAKMFEGKRKREYEIKKFVQLGGKVRPGSVRMSGLTPAHHVHALGATQGEGSRQDRSRHDCKGLC